MKLSDVMLLGAVLAVLLCHGALYADRIADTPKLIQDGFGVGGFELEGNGSMWCGPTSTTMSLGYLANQGFTQLLPASATSDDYLNLERIVAGLAGAGFTTGTNGADLDRAASIYTQARGLSTLSFNQTQAPTVSDFTTAQTDPYTATIMTIEWMRPQSPGSTVYDRAGGHFVSIVGTDLSGPGTPASNYLVVNNPEPSSLFNVPDLPSSLPQYAHVIEFTGTSGDGTLNPADTYYQFDNNQTNSTQAPPVTTRAVQTYIITFSLNASDLNTGGWTPATWNLTGDSNTLFFNEATLEVTAPITGSVGIVKSGSGTLQITNSNDTLGGNIITHGRVELTSSDQTALGTGSITLGSATLQLAPTDTALTQSDLASGTGNSFTYDAGAVLEIQQTNPVGYSVNLGGATTRDASLVRSGTGTFEIFLDSAAGLADLGTATGTQVHITGTGTLPNANGMISPDIIAGDDSDATFLTHNVTQGLIAATYTASTGTDINSTTNTTIYDMTNNQTVNASSTASVHALRVTSATLSGDTGSTLQVGPQTNGDVAGVILNDATVDTPTLEFGQADIAIFAVGDSTVDSNISGSGPLIKFGQGRVTLTADNTATFTGETYVNTGTLVIASSAGGATGNGDVYVRQDGTLQINDNATMTSATFTSGATIDMRGGTIAALSMDDESTLTGFGTISSAATLNGTVSPGLGTLSFSDDVTLNSDGMIAWTLGSLVDNITGTPGTNWSFVEFTNAGATIDFNGMALAVDVEDVESPNSGNPFWDEDHAWTVINSQVNLGSSIDLKLAAAKFSQGRFSWVHGGNGTGGTLIELRFTPVPEPSTLLALGLGCAVLLRRRR